MLWRRLPLLTILICVLPGLPLMSRAAEKPVANVEEFYPLWSLVHLEAKTKDARYPFARRRGDFSKKILRGLNASMLDLSGFNFQETDLRGADFTGCVLRNTNFSGADLSEAVFTSATDRDALYDAKTKLPFPKEEARARGWIELAR